MWIKYQYLIYYLKFILGNRTPLPISFCFYPISINLTAFSSWLFIFCKAKPRRINGELSFLYRLLCLPFYYYFCSLKLESFTLVCPLDPNLKLLNVKSLYLPLCWSCSKSYLAFYHFCFTSKAFYKFLVTATLLFRWILFCGLLII